MPIEHVPLLKTQRELHDLPRGMERFEAYLKTMLNDTRDDVRYLPLLVMNPMGREHVAERLDEMIALDADALAAESIREALAELGDLPDTFQHGWVVMDDIRGGWTNRTVNDAKFRFDWELPLKRPWITSGWWVSETPTRETLRQKVRESVGRLAYLHKYGIAKTLRQMMEQEGAVAAFAGFKPRYDDEEQDYNRHVIEPLLDSADYPTQIAALYGDSAASSLGYAPLGLSENAGFDLALASALATGETRHTL
jgi:hypothetical protein